MNLVIGAIEHYYHDPRAPSAPHVASQVGHRARKGIRLGASLKRLACASEARAPSIVATDVASG